MTNNGTPSDYERKLIELHRKQLETQRTISDLLIKIAANNQLKGLSRLLTQRKIYKAEAIDLLGISERSYDRKKADGLLKPRGIGHDFYYAEDLEKALEESRRRGKI